MKYIISISSFLLFCGCFQQPEVCSKYSPEEIGYIDEVHFLVNACVLDMKNRLGLHTNNNILSEQFSLPSCQGVYNPETSSRLYKSSLTNRWTMTTDKKKVGEGLSEIIPPQNFKEIHEKLITYSLALYQLDTMLWMQVLPENEKTATEHNNKRYKLLMDLLKIEGDVLQSFNKILPEINSRPSLDVYTQRVINVVYQPPGIPVELRVSNKGEFSISTVSTVNTPIGNIGLSSEEKAGIRKIIIKDNLKIKILSLDRPFRFFVPSKYGFEIISESNDVLIIEIKQPPTSK